MIDRLHLKLFKCFEELSLPLAPLTILSGANSSGKSSVMHSLLLLQQTMLEHEQASRLLLNGPSVRLGTVADVVDQINGRKDFSICLEAGGESVAWRLSGERTDMAMRVDEVNINGDRHTTWDELRYLLPPNAPDAMTTLADNLRTANYVTAERMGPRDVYLLDDPVTTVNVGSAGQHAVSLLYWLRDERVPDALCVPDHASTLERQVEARMQSFFPGFNLDLSHVPQASAVTLGLRTSETTGFHRPANVGFGLTQVLPIVIAALSSSPGRLLLIENPEVHLHPAGQSKIGRFVAEVAAAGVQVVVETHSDHVLNGVRRAVRAGQLAHNDVALHYFQARLGDQPQVIMPMMDGSGSLTEWPAGFFDQYDEDVNVLAGWAD